MLINKYVVTDGELKGKVLNAEKSTSWQTPVYEASTTAGTDPGTNPGTDLKLIRGPYTRSEKVEGRPENRETKIKEEEKTVSVSFFEGQILKLTVREHEAFTRAHPKADLEAEYRKMDAWLVANPNRPKKSFARFANNWLLNSRNLTPKKKTPTDDLEFPYRLG